MGSEEDAHKLAEEGLEFFRSGRFTEAAALFEKALVYEPGNIQLWSFLAQSYASMGDYEDALKSLDKALEIDDGNFLNWQLKGTFLMRQNRMEEAKVAIDRSLELNRSATSFLLRGQLDYNMGKHEEALGFFDKALERDPDHPLANQMKGMVLFLQERYGEAIPHIEKALEVGSFESLEKILAECRKRSESQQ